MASSSTQVEHGSFLAASEALDASQQAAASAQFSGPQPLPDFIFPARPAALDSPTSPLYPNSARPVTSSGIVRDGVETTKQRVGRQNLPPPLPAFSFNAASIPNAQETPPLSPGTGPSALGISSVAHRRGASELVQRSSSADANGAPIPSSSEPPGGRKRGHAHRRSAAISCHDFSAVLKPTNGNAPPRGGSAPASPSEQDHKVFPGIEGAVNPKLAQSHSTSDLAAQNYSPIKPASRARVGFSDDVEFIPRPLSIISSDASSTTTVRPGHSVSNSMSSIVSGSMTSSPAAKHVPSPHLARTNEGRPKTAGPVLDISLVKGQLPNNDGSPTSSRSSVRLNTSAPSSKCHSPVSPKSGKKPWGFFGAENLHDQASTKSQPSSTHSVEEVAAPAALNDSPCSTPTSALPPIERTTSRRSSTTRKSAKKRKKVKVLAGLLSRKPLYQKHSTKAASRRSPTPPMRHVPPINRMTESPCAELSRPEVKTFDSEHQMVYSQESSLHVQTEIKTSLAKSKIAPPDDDDDAMSPMIDLDAALGPFNTPMSYDPTWDLVINGSGSRPRKMHSAMAASNIGMAGMMYHRRAESAPEFENPRFKYGRLGSSSTMADVFEEDEEEDWEDAKHSDKESCTKPETEMTLNIYNTDSGPVDTDIGMELDKDGNDSRLSKKSSAISDDWHTQTTSASHSENNSLHETASAADLTVQSELNGVGTSRPASLAPSETSSIPQSRHRSAHKLAPVETQGPTLQSHLTPATPVSIAESPRTPMSDTQRIFSTAPSSISEDHTADSLLLGEPGPELIRMSVEDVPSLTSTNSTMTRDSNSMRPSSMPFRDGQRSASLSGPTGTKKRSSMASLSRLIGSSHGEKSKLSIEMRPSTAIESGHHEKTKSRGISRLVNFWRPKSMT